MDMKGIFMKKAFTLAEVLITLAIIGIVAALTIPSVISNYQQQEFKTGLKKAVSVLNEAIQTNIASDGETPYENDDLFSYIQKHMSILKSGRTDWRVRQQGENWSTEGGNMVFYTTDGMRYEVSSMGHKEQRLHESNVVISRHEDFRGGNFGKVIGNCGSYGLSENPNKTTNAPCLITVDVNGDKKPNPQLGLVGNEDFGYTEFGNYNYPSPTDKKVNDLFNILITEDKAIPFGVVAQRAMYSK